MTDNSNRNLILAILLSAIVLFGWSWVVERFVPTPPPPTAAAEVPAAEQQPAGPILPPAGAAIAGAAPTAPAAARQAAPRVAIDTPRLSGSISLEGPRIDDLVLLDHRTSILSDSQPIRLFAPSDSAQAYFAGFGWVGDDVPPPDARWTASGSRLTPETPVTLSWTSPRGTRFLIELSVDRNFLFTVRQRVQNPGADAVTVRAFGYVNRTGRGPDRDAFNLHVGPLAVAEGRLREREVRFDRLADEGPRVYRTDRGWGGITDKHWLAALIPDQSTPFELRFTPADGNRTQVDWLAPALSVPGGRQADSVSHLFAGAKEVALLNQVRDQLGVPLFDRALAWGWFWFIAQPIYALLAWLYGVFGNYALAIVGLTLVVRLILFPIANKQYASMAKMRVFAPKMKELQERYKDNKQKMQMELMELYKREKINPLAGCLPILLQIPIFYALYKVLLISVEIRHQPAFLWIRDLSAPDPLTPLNLFGLLPFDLPPLIHLGVLPIILGITMWAQFRLNPQPMDPIQQKVFAWMPWIFMFIMAPFAAGLQIYWIVNNLVSILQQWILIRKYPAPAPAPARAGGK